ncbi:MAG: YhbY family RNA-binding protein [Planctomycetota bacterium]|nr:YhbY family RNA-binding protein [Planctomycetota bacterium]
MSDERLPGPHLRRLKSLGQLLKPVVHVGKGGLTPQVVATVVLALADHELIKVKFEAHKDEKKALAPELAQRTGSHLIQRVGNVLVLYRQQPEPRKRKILLAGPSETPQPVPGGAA